jgi:hypothetical protein
VYVWNSCIHALDKEFTVFGKTMDLAWFLTCMLCWTLEWHFGNAIWGAIAQPDFLYKESIFTAGIGTLRNKKNFKLRYETLTPPLIQHTCLYDCILSLCYLIKFLVESSSIVYLSHK